MLQKDISKAMFGNSSDSPQFHVDMAQAIQNNSVDITNGKQLDNSPSSSSLTNKTDPASPAVKQKPKRSVRKVHKYSVHPRELKSEKDDIYASMKRSKKKPSGSNRNNINEGSFDFDNFDFDQF